jgi:hypothetical protein
MQTNVTVKPLYNTKHSFPFCRVSQYVLLFLQGHTGVVEQLLGAGATVDCVTEEGMTPLHCTVHLRNCVQAGESTARMKNVMRLLIEALAPHIPSLSSPYHRRPCQCRSEFSLE